MCGFFINPLETNEGLRLSSYALELHVGCICICERRGS